MHIYLPQCIRYFVFTTAGNIYGIDLEEIKADLNSFKTWNEFFTRELKDGARTIDSPDDPKTLVSPCDGKVLRITEVDSEKSTIDPVKGISYGLDEFLLGNRDEAEGQKSALKRMVNAAKDRGNKVMLMIMYLCPGDYHRYHSPATFTAGYRRHIAGFLQCVDPSYIEQHPYVHKTNERVNIFGNWNYGFLAVSFVGALNVGSIQLHFDKTLFTNNSNP